LLLHVHGLPQEADAPQTPAAADLGPLAVHDKGAPVVVRHRRRGLLGRVLVVVERRGLVRGPPRLDDGRRARRALADLVAVDVPLGVAVVLVAQVVEFRAAVDVAVGDARGEPGAVDDALDAVAALVARALRGLVGGRHGVVGLPDVGHCCFAASVLRWFLRRVGSCGGGVGQRCGVLWQRFC
ncbi:unnamed protein product, partial [Pelagomonas calceolata]